MIDTHCHILPGIDDGAAGMNDSLEMAKMLVGEGVTAVFATPHVLDADTGPRNDDILKRVSELQEAVAGQGFDLKIFSGAEYYLGRSVADTVRLHFPVTGMAGSKCLLVELPFVNWPPYLQDSTWPRDDDPREVREVLPFLRPVIAHPERYAEVVKDHKILRPLRERGYLFQVNLEGICGLYGRSAKKTIKKMANEGMIDLVGTDGHSPRGLARYLPGMRQKVEKLLGKDVAQRVLVENPQKIIDHETIHTDY